MLHNSVKLLPWLGTDYLRGIDGKRVMGLGESHYSADGRWSAEMTREVIRDLFDPQGEFEPYKNTYTKFERAVAGRELDWEGKRRFWNSLMFYNYVQEVMSGPRVAPTAQQFRDSEAAFFEVLNEYRPQLVIVWGQRLYNNLPQQGRQLPDLIVPGADSHELWEYRLENGDPVIVLKITHPSAAFSPDYWHKVIMAALAICR